jgi:hypothetical protein
MASFSRKLKRKNQVAQRKKFMKDFRSAMENFKSQVKCSNCDRPPHEGEKIDEWRIIKSEKDIELICTDCYTEGEGENNEV